MFSLLARSSSGSNCNFLRGSKRCHTAGVYPPAQVAGEAGKGGGATSPAASRDRACGLGREI